MAPYRTRAGDPRHNGCPPRAGLAQDLDLGFPATAFAEVGYGSINAESEIEGGGSFTADGSYISTEVGLRRISDQGLYVSFIFNTIDWAPITATNNEKPDRDYYPNKAEFALGIGWEWQLGENGEWLPYVGSYLGSYTSLVAGVRYRFDNGLEIGGRAQGLCVLGDDPGTVTTDKYSYSGGDFTCTSYGVTVGYAF